MMLFRALIALAIVLLIWLAILWRMTDGVAVPCDDVGLAPRWMHRVATEIHGIQPHDPWYWDYKRGEYVFERGGQKCSFRGRNDKWKRIVE